MAQAGARKNCNPHLTNVRDGSCPALCPAGRQEGGQAAHPVLQNQPREVAEEHPPAREGVRGLERLLRMPAWEGTTSPPQPRCGCCRCLLQAVHAVIIDRLAAVTHSVCPSYKPGSSPPGSLHQAVGRRAAGIAWISPKLPSSWAHHLRKYVQNQLKT